MENKYCNKPEWNCSPCELEAGNIVEVGFGAVLDSKESELETWIKFESDLELEALNFK